MSRRDIEIDDLISNVLKIADYARLGMLVSSYGNCNDCKQKGCKYKPKLGDSVRWNCPLWKCEVTE